MLFTTSFFIKVIATCIHLMTEATLNTEQANGRNRHEGTINHFRPTNYYCWWKVCKFSILSILAQLIGCPSYSKMTRHWHLFLLRDCQLPTGIFLSLRFLFTVSLNLNLGLPIPRRPSLSTGFVWVVWSHHGSFKFADKFV